MTKILPSRLNELAGIQYLGLDGTSSICLEAVQNLIQNRTQIERVQIITHENLHALLFFTECDGPIAVKSGFSSGYSGSGPSAFSTVLQLLFVLQVDIDECEVSEELFRRLGVSALTRKDIETIEATSPVRPQRLYRYIDDYDSSTEAASKLLKRFKSVMPWTIIDSEIFDVGLTFFEGPDKAILDAFRRLEDKVRKRTGLTEHGVKLFQQAFLSDAPALCWKDLDKGEQVGRAHLFTGAIQAFRNPRAHREQNQSESDLLREFLMVNQLFVLERQAIKCGGAQEKEAAPVLRKYIKGA